jgi:hypothetical protein
VVAAIGTIDARSVAELTRVLFGEALNMDQVVARLQTVDLPESWTPTVMADLWVGSIGYELHKDHLAFARRGYAKSALAQAMADVGVEYIHVRALGNPKRFRDLYKSGRVEEGQRRYEEHLLGEQRGALEDLGPLLREKPSALMCVEHDAATCHRSVILEALRRELGLALDVAEIG